MKIDLNRFLPLAPATLHILLALAGEDLHGCFLKDYAPSNW